MFIDRWYIILVVPALLLGLYAEGVREVLAITTRVRARCF